MIGTETETLKIVIKAKDEASKVFSKFSKKHNETIKNLKKLGVVGGAAVGAVGVASMKMAADFEKSMSNVATLVDTNVESMEDMERAVLDISKRTPVALEDLSSALYDVRSAGIDAGGAMEVLENSAKLAVTGLGTTKEATNVLTSAINAFGLDAKKSDRWADVFFKTVKSGKTNISELAQGFGQVAPLANELGLEFEDLMATTAAMTTSGMQASVAYTQQRAVLSSMLKPTKQMSDAMANVGITSENLSEIVSEKGLTGTIRMLSESVGGNKAELAKMFGSVEGLNAVMMLLGDTGENSIDIFNQMTEGGNAMDEAMRKQNETASAQYQILKNQLNAEMINLGNHILPILINAIPVLIDWGNQLKGAFDAITDSLGSLIYKGMQAVEWMGKVKKSATGAVSKAKSVVSAGAERTKTGGLGGLWEDVGKIGKWFGFQHGTDYVPATGLYQLHKGEAIVPSHRNAGGTITNIYVQGGNYLDREAGEKFAEVLGEKFRRELRY
ncbi:phage tail tape measure protein [Candidatus Parcubacteria bacterium]|nr:phage tail tape measure protein [Candidatus Parcubacteria bacterium]